VPDRELTAVPQPEPLTRQPGPVTAVAPAVARVLQLQQTVGNAAVSRMMAARNASRTVAREPTDAPAAPAGPAGAAEGGSRVAQLAEQAGSAGGLRSMLGADPGLAGEISAYFAAGNDDPALNSMMGAAFAPEPAADTATATEEVGAEKQPKDATIPLPGDITGNKTLDKGTMKWTVKAVSHSQGRVDVDFKADATKVEAKTISFGQTVVNKVGTGLAYAGGTAADPAKNKATFEPFEEATSKKRADHLPGSENDPFYGAEWDQANKKWKQERSDWKIGSSTKDGTSTSASMFDTPGTPWAREGHGDVSIEFETVPMVLETRQPLGALLWGYKIKDEENAPIELTGGQDADVTDAPSADWGKTMDQFYAAKYAEILDDFDIGKADLKADHKTKLDNVAAKLKATVTLKAQCGGAADLTGDAEFNKALSLKRATAARDYLVGKGIDGGRLEVQSYGADWARVEAAPGTSEGKNRRVQIWVH
jgi:outer membrane protein OmpA-like peptidoglycan-associated protein